MAAYTDDDLRDAVSRSRSWRGVLRTLGLAGTSAASIRSVRRRADALDLPRDHFTGGRTWTDHDLREAISEAPTWAEVAQRVGLTGGSAVTTVRSHAVRLGIRAPHIDGAPEPSSPLHSPDAGNLCKAGPVLAAAWFTLCGYDVSWPLEPARYDLIAWFNGGAQRIQVKTTTVRSGGSWQANIAASGTERTPYPPDAIDWFFVIDGELRNYLIPFERVVGLLAIQLSAYEDCRVTDMTTI